jgi:hypothetical protein
MGTKEPLLEVRFSGPAMGPARIPLSTLLQFLSTMRTAIQRTGSAIHGEDRGGKRGTSSAVMASEMELDLVGLTHGSPDAVLQFEGPRAHKTFPEMDGVEEVLEASVVGLNTLLTDSEDGALPRGYNAGVIKAWGEVVPLFGKGVNQIVITLNLPEGPVVSTLTKEGAGRLREKLKGPQVQLRTIEGRLQMADFRESAPRCRIHPALGDSIICTFDVEQSSEVLQHLTKWVRVIGEAKEGTGTGKIKSLTIHEIERIEPRGGRAADAAASHAQSGFWERHSLQELAAAQGVQPVHDISSLYGTWPGEDDDGFEDLIEELRHPEVGEEVGT